MSDKMLGNMNGQKWAPQHSETLRFLVESEVGSYRVLAGIINERFGTAYSRDAVIGRGYRMGLENMILRELVMRWADIQGVRVTIRPLASGNAA